MPEPTSETLQERFVSSIKFVCLSWKVDSALFTAWLQAQPPLVRQCFDAAGTRQRALLGQACKRMLDEHK